MYTRCPGCHTVHPVSAALLASGAGHYLCGKCGKECNALECLFDEWPEPGETAPAEGAVPTLGLHIDLEAAAEPEKSSLFASLERSGIPKEWLQRAWVVGLVLILLIVAIQWVRFLNEPYSAQPRSAGEQRGVAPSASGAERPTGNFEWIHLVSRELRSHPTLPGTLQLTATIVNRAERPQPYPLISLKLLDAAGQPVHQQYFAPADYLPAGAGGEDGMAPEAYLPLTLEFDDPGLQAVGFELEFE